MTDARLPERYLMDRRIVRLNDTARSSYFMAVLWSVSNRTDGRIEREDLPLIPTFNTSSAKALVDCGLWIEHGNGWLDVEFAKVQTSKSDLEVLENARRADREKKARMRAAKKDSTPDFPGSVPGTIPGDSTGEERTGKARTGKASTESVNFTTGEVDSPSLSWAVAEIPRSSSDPGCCSHGVTVGAKCRHCPDGVASARAA